MVVARKRNVNGMPMAIMTGIATFKEEASKKSISPTKKRMSADWRSRGMAEKICGTYHASRPSARIWNNPNFSLKERELGYCWCSLSHWRETMPMRAVARLSTRLMNQYMFTRIDEAEGGLANDAILIGCAMAGKVLLFGLSSWEAIRARRLIMTSFWSV